MMDTMDSKMSDMELKSMADTIMKAHEIQNDPELMKKLSPFLDKKVRAIKSIADLKKIREEKNKEANEPASEEKGESDAMESSEP